MQEDSNLFTPNPLLPHRPMKKSFSVETTVYECESYKDIVDALNHGLTVKIAVDGEDAVCDCRADKDGIGIYNADGIKVDKLTADCDEYFYGMEVYAVKKYVVDHVEDGFETEEMASYMRSLVK